MAVAAKDAGPGLDRAELKKALIIARRQPMHCAFALGADGKPVIMIDKIKKGPGLDRDLKLKAPDTKNHRFGVVEIDQDNPKLCRFTINKAGTGGMARKLIIALKGTGFNKVLIQLEDGTAVESEEGEDEETGDEVAAAGQGGTEDNGDAAPTPATANADPAAAPNTDNQSQDVAASSAQPASGTQQPAQPAAGTQQAAGPDVASLTADLTALVKQMVTVIATDPTKKSALAELAIDAQSSLKRGDLQGASAGIDVLREALSGAGDTSSQPSPNGAAPPAPAPTAPAPGAAAPPDASAAAATSSPNGAPPAAPAPGAPAPPDASAAAATIAKARTAWTATRKKVEGDLGKLHDQFGSAFKGHEQEDQITKAFRDRVETVLEALDEGLANTLDSVNNAKDPGERARLVQQAQTLLHQYQQHVATDPTIAALDSNPFVPLAVAKTMSATIDALSRSIR